MTVQSFSVVQSDWPDAEGFFPWTITDGVQSKGNFATKAEAEENMERIILNWRCDS